MAYEYSEKVLTAWDWPAQAALWKLRAQHAQQETKYWKGIATALQARQSAGGGTQDDRA
jgi:hypothetical protein